MLTRLIVDLYAWIMEIFLWITLPISSVVGYNVIVPILNDAGAILENEIAWKVFGAIIFPVVTLLVLAVAIGPFLVLVDIRKSIRALEAKSNGSSSGVLPFEPREPSL